MKKLTSTRQQRGFTLVELSVVLVVVGLLFAAVVKGQEVVDSAKSQKLINDIKSTEALIQKYAQIKSRMPGDCDSDGVIDFPADKVDRLDTGNSGRANLYDYTTSQKTYATAGVGAEISTVHMGCAQENGAPYSVGTVDDIGANNWINDLKLAGLVSDSVPNRTFAKQVNEDFLFVGSVTDASGASPNAAKYNAIIVQNVPQWMARQVATAINGTDANSNRSRVRQLVRNGADGSYVPLWSDVESTSNVMRDAMVSVVYFFDRIPATNTD
ncbi:MAG: prepilin-type N-terminal cleavage/methylation domain-containing protein [Polaromonas sp.]|nr:prepilin-type N-terminal cleavage/methylation domain-containing protein [Polaromonas sp.]